MATRAKKISLYEDEGSFTGWSIASREGAGLPATIWEVALWKMYLSAMEEIVRLSKVINELNQANNTP